MAQTTQLGPGIHESIRNMPTIIAASDLCFEAGYLVGECPPAHVDGPVPVRIHTE